MSTKERERVVICDPTWFKAQIEVYENGKRRVHPKYSYASGVRFMRLMTKLCQQNNCHVALFTFGWSLAVYGDANTATGVH